MFTNNDLIVAIVVVVVIAALAGVASLYLHQRVQRNSRGNRARRYADAWTELQRQCMRLVEEDEIAGADQDELGHAAVITAR